MCEANSHTYNIICTYGNVNHYFNYLLKLIELNSLLWKYKDMETSNIFAKKRKELRLRQSDVANMLNIDRSTISKWETGNAFPDISLLPKLADLYNVSIDYLLGREAEFDGLNIVQPLLQKTEIQIAYDAMNERQQDKVLSYARGLLAGEGVDLDTILRKNK